MRASPNVNAWITSQPPPGNPRLHPPLRRGQPPLRVERPRRLLPRPLVQEQPVVRAERHRLADHHEGRE
eukprot:2429353-Alexandrium_andersonii.AAC.1